MENGEAPRDQIEIRFRRSGRKLELGVQCAGCKHWAVTAIDSAFGEGVASAAISAVLRASFQDGVFYEAPQAPEGIYICSSDCLRNLLAVLEWKTKANGPELLEP